jgi:hypothetical protein
MAFVERPNNADLSCHSHMLQLYVFMFSVPTCKFSYHPSLRLKKSIIMCADLSYKQYC